MFPFSAHVHVYLYKGEKNQKYYSKHTTTWKIKLNLYKFWILHVSLKEIHVIDLKIWSLKNKCGDWRPNTNYGC